MTIDIRSKHLDLTDANRAYAEEKMSTLEKYFDRIERIDCELGMDSHHHTQGRVYICAGHLFVPGKDFFVEKSEDDLYKAIDRVRDHLKEVLIEWKKKSREVEPKEEKS